MYIFQEIFINFFSFDDPYFAPLQCHDLYQQLIISRIDSRNKQGACEICYLYICVESSTN